jgi:hypothetical protein
MPYIKSGNTAYAALRRAAIAIWINSLVEFLEKRRERDGAIVELNKAGNCPSVVVERINEFNDAAIEILSCFSEEEQIVFWYIRNQAVHGHLSLYFHDKLCMSFFDVSSCVVFKKTISRGDVDIATRALAEFKPMQRLAPYNESNPLLNLDHKHLNTAAIASYHKVLFGKTL